MMGFRLAELERALAGFRETGVLLVSRTPDGNLRPAGFSDDLGTFLLAPPLAKWLDASVGRVAEAIHMGALLLSSGLAVLGVLLLFREWKWRIPAVLAVLWYTKFAWRVLIEPGADVYIYYAVPLLAAVPLQMAAFRLGHPRVWLAVAILTGFLAGAANIMRANSGYPVLFLGVVLIWSASLPRARRALLTAALLAAALVPHLGQQVAVQYREAFLREQLPDYAGHTQGHPLWHTVYIGLGFLPNPYGLEYLDEVAFNKAAALDPAVRPLSPEYEALLRGEVLELLRRDPGFVVRTILAKLWVMVRAMYELRLLWFGILGCWGVYLWRRFRGAGSGPWHPILAWSLWPVVGFYALPGLLAVPIYPYYAGVFTCVLVYLVVVMEALRGYRLVETSAGRQPSMDE